MPISKERRVHTALLRAKPNAGYRREVSTALELPPMSAYLVGADVVQINNLGFLQLAHSRANSRAIESSWNRLQLPRDGDARVGKIGAVSASANGPFEVCAQRRMLGTDTPHGLSDRACHTGSGAFCCGTDASIASSESNRAGQLAREEVAFGLCLRHP